MLMVMEQQQQQQPIQPATVVVIHPGSFNLRIGRASDAFPVTIPHCIARRNKIPSSSSNYTDSWLLRSECQHHDIRYQQRQGLKKAEDALINRPNSSGEFRQQVSCKQLAALNMISRGEKTNVISPLLWTNTDRQPPYIIGEEALYTHHSDSYTVKWPFRRGHLNLHEGVGGSQSSVLCDIETIWGSAIQTYLDIPLKDLKHYRALLLIPDVYRHQQIKQLTDILLTKLGFGAAIIQQESVCATFGAGLTSACVVDIGDQKTSICCVEDGISHKKTRLTLEYGGSDISRCFYWLLGRSGIDLTDLNLNHISDILTLQSLKHSICHLNQDKAGILDHTLQIKRPQEPIIKYPVKLGDEPIVAPLSIFFPDLMGLQGAHLVAIQKRNPGDPEDPYDEHYLQQTMSKQQEAARLNAAKKKETTDSTNQTTENPSGENSLSQFDESQFGQSQVDEDSNDAVDNMDASRLGRKLEADEEQDQDVDVAPALMGVDQAILHSIGKCASDELKKKMYSCILVVGGGLMFEGAQSWLQWRVWVHMDPQHRLMLETQDVITRPKDMDPRLTCWKGASILACLDTTQELWIKQCEWTQYSVRMLRERAPFNW